MEQMISSANSASKDVTQRATKSIPQKGRTLFSLLNKIKYGSLSIIHPQGNHTLFKGSEPGPHVEIKINHWSMASAMLGSGDIGLGESYKNKAWECDHIDKLIEFGVLNQKEIEKVATGTALRVLYYRFRHWLNRNTKSGSQRNIHSHYDLGNHFYDKWLDGTMTYSSALFTNTNETLYQAQLNKYNRILDQLNASVGESIIEIGCGWGGFIKQALLRGLKITGVTLSKEQYKYCLDLYKDNEDVTILYSDYRDLTGKYDHIVSIEMFEALGEQFWPTYFEKLKSLLKDNGNAVIQTITINDHDFQSYRKGSDFIQQFIFPGGMLPSPREFKKQCERVDFILEDEFNFGISYAETLKFWDINYNVIKSSLDQDGFDDEFHRLWHFYLKYCEGGFRSGKIDVYQFKIMKGSNG